MGSYAEDCSSLIRFMESIDSKIERMSKAPVVDISHNLKAKKVVKRKRKNQAMIVGKDTVMIKKIIRMLPRYVIDTIVNCTNFIRFIIQIKLIQLMRF